MSTAVLAYRYLGFDDDPQTRNPRQNLVSRDVEIPRVPIDGAGTIPPFYVPAFSTLDVFDASRGLTYDGSTGFQITTSPLAVGRYRLTWTGAGAAPGFRVSRSVNLVGGSVIAALQTDQSLVVTFSAGGPFSAVQPGDTALIPGTATGDPAGPFSPLNEGVWVVLAASATQLTLARPQGANVQGASETVPITSGPQIRFYAAIGVQPGDRVEFLAGLTAALTHDYPVVATTDTTLDFTSTTPVPAVAFVPGVAGLAVYDHPRTTVLVETDQEIAVRPNGVADDRLRIRPPDAVGDRARPGFWFASGPVWRLQIRNRSAVPARVLVSAGA